MSGSWWRIDGQQPAAWSWDGFAEPVHRFDPPSGRFRVRYGANHPRAAARERFPGKAITADHDDLVLVELRADTAALHLTHQQNLDALGLDDRINTGRIDALDTTGDALLDTSQALSDAVYDWWDGDPPPLVYRTRSVPSARSMAFHAHTSLIVLQARPLREAYQLLATLVARHGFTVPHPWLT